MVLWFIHYLRGFLSVKFEGVYSEAILTKIAAEKISIWNLVYKNGIITGKIYSKDFTRLRKLRKGTGIKIKILEKSGLPFFIMRHKNRVGLIVGAVFFFFILEILSSFIWVINISGNNKVPTSDILNSLNEIGIFENMHAADIDSKILAQRLLLKRKDLAWASLNVEGCVLNVNVTEVKDALKTKEKPPVNQVAAKDGIIRKIDAVAGDVRVKIGDNVHKGDILISGIVENITSTSFVHSDGKVIAQVEEVYKARSDFLQSFAHKTGKNKTKRVLEILGARIPLFLAQKEKQANVSYKCGQIKIMGNRVPLKLYTANYDYYNTVYIRFGEDTLKNQLSSDLQKFLNSKAIDGYIPLSTTYKKDNDGIVIIHRYLCEKNIAKEKKILLSQKIDKKR
ncbi:MAG: sporulation protein YqfD [Clostridia bacterium]|nr:sporulation protein YqfD [Clostridia bacterium]